MAGKEMRLFGNVLECGANDTLEARSSGLRLQENPIYIIFDGSLRNNRYMRSGTMSRHLALRTLHRFTAWMPWGRIWSCNHSQK